MSTRIMTAEFAAALASGRLRPALLFEGEFATGVVRVWTGLEPVTWDGKEFTGLGILLGFGTFEETEKVEAAGTSVTLSGVSPELVSVAINEAQQGLPGRVWLALLTEDREIIADPVQAVTARLDVPTLDEGANTCSITITYENRLIDLTRAREWRYTHESQQVLAPGDMAFEYVATIQEQDLRWG